MAEPMLVPLDKIDANPFQPRQSEDAEAVAELAINIARNGLLQIPSARAVDGRYQLVFGHTRLAAYRRLNSGLVDGVPAGEFATMPLYIRELDDRQMFEQAVSENIKRRNLNPVEQAQAMQTYMTRFEATSAQAAELFGVSDVTVRGKVRLLDLPESVQDQVAGGTISEGTARKILTVHRVAPSAVVKATENVTADMNPAEIERKLIDAVKKSKGTVVMQERYGGDADKPRAGRGLWPLEWRHKGQGLPFLCADDLLKAIGKDEKAKNYGDMLEGAGELLRYMEGGMVVDGHLSEWTMAGLGPDDVEAIQRFFNPPVCLDCPVYARLDDGHYCGWKVCHERKQAAWIAAEMARLTKDLGFRVYEESDGEGKEINYLWGAEEEAFKLRVKEVDPNLRLKVNTQFGYQAYPITKSHIILLVDVSPEAKEKIRIERERQEQRVREQKADQNDWETRRVNQEKSEGFLHEVAIPACTGCLAGIKNIEVLKALDSAIGGYRDQEEAVGENDLRLGIVEEMLDRNWDGHDMAEGPVEFAKHLRGVATTWGVQLPDDWLELAKKYEDGPVSTETENQDEEADTDAGDA